MKKVKFLLALGALLAGGFVSQAQNLELVPAKIVNNSVFPDNQIYVGIMGKEVGTNRPVYYNLADNSSADAALVTLTTDANTLHKEAGDRGFANVFTTLDKIKDKTIYIARTHACRMFIGFNSPMYLHVNDNNGGFAGADMQNPSDPNIDVRWELCEFSYDENYVMFINTTRVDAFQYPMGVELYGGEGANNAYMKRGELVDYNDIIARWKSENQGNVFYNCLQSNVKKDQLGEIIMQPSKVADVKNHGFFDDYISRIWTAFAGKELNVSLGVLGKWRGKVSGDNFVLTSYEGNRNGQTAVVGRPTTVDVIEGAGEFAKPHGNDADLPVQAMFCGAMNRGVIDVNLADGELQDWGDTSKFFKVDTYNPYVKFFHEPEISYDAYTYAFAYDDTFDQSSTCATSHPASITLTIGGFVNQPSGDPGKPDEPVKPEEPVTPSIAAAPDPEIPEVDVKSIFSDKYTPVTGSWFGTWGQSTATEEETLDGNKAYHSTNFNYLGIELADKVDASDMKYVHIDIYPTSDFTMGFYPITINENGTNDHEKKNLELKAGEWNSFDMPLSEFPTLDLKNLAQFKMDGGNGQDFHFDNLYLWRDGNKNPDIPTVDPDQPEQPDQPSTDGDVKRVTFTADQASQGTLNGGGWIEFNYDGTDVKVSVHFDGEYEGFAGPWLWNQTNGFAEVPMTPDGDGVYSAKLSGYKTGDVIKVSVKIAFAGGMAVTPQAEYTVPVISAVNAIALGEDTPREYYNLQGIRVAQPERGAYIVRQGSRTYKTVIK